MAKKKSFVSLSKTIGYEADLTLGFQLSDAGYSSFSRNFYIGCKDSDGNFLSIRFSESDLNEIKKFVETAKTLVK